MEFRHTPTVACGPTHLRECEKTMHYHTLFSGPGDWRLRLSSGPMADPDNKTVIPVNGTVDTCRCADNGIRDNSPAEIRRVHRRTRY